MVEVDCTGPFCADFGFFLSLCVAIFLCFAAIFPMFFPPLKVVNYSHLHAEELFKHLCHALYVEVLFG